MRVVNNRDAKRAAFEVLRDLIEGTLVDALPAAGAA
jgi:hypothetical protein